MEKIEHGSNSDDRVVDRLIAPMILRADAEGDCDNSRNAAVSTEET